MPVSVNNLYSYYIHMYSLTNTFLRNKGRPDDPIETLREQAARAYVNQLPDKSSINAAVADMIDSARARAWAREAVALRKAQNLEWSNGKYMRAVADMGKNITSLNGNRLEPDESPRHNLRHLLDPETARTFLETRNDEYPLMEWTEYETVGEQEFRHHGKRLSVSFMRYAKDRLAIPRALQNSRNAWIVGVGDFLGVNDTAAVAILADLVQEFEEKYNEAALLN